MLNGRDLIVYILQNNMENEPIFKDGRFLGFLSLAEFAERWDVGEETVRLWITLGYVEGLIIYDEIYIPYNATIKEPKREA